MTAPRYPSRTVQETARVILRHLRDNPEGLSKAELAVMAGVSGVTVQRTINYMREKCDAPLYFVRDSNLWRLTASVLASLCARLSADTRIAFTVNAAGAVEIAAGDAFKLATFLELGCVEMTNEACRRHPERDKDDLLARRRARAASQQRLATYASMWSTRPYPCGRLRR